MSCAIAYGAEHPFPLQNLPYGIFSAPGRSARPGVAIGDCILDLHELSRSPLFAGAGVEPAVFQGDTLNAFVSLPPAAWAAFRAFLTALLTSASLTADSPLFVSRIAADTQLHLPLHIGDYTDFYASLEHATNCGTLLRGPERALQANWRHLPVAYHGRASSIVPSGTAFHRPAAQILPPSASQPVFAASQRLDYELELGFVIGGPATPLGTRLSPAAARERIFGAVLLNDWSARDVQSWEYVPLGPFLSKNFCTSISPWLVPMAALEPFRVAQTAHEPPLLPYLRDADGCNYDVPLFVEIKARENDAYELVATSSLQHTYYTAAQMLAHHSTSGCSMRAGDVLGTGTLSAPGEAGYGSLLEKTHMGQRPFALGRRADMTWLRDGDSVRMTALARGDGFCIGFGECEGTVLPALPLQSE